MDADGRIYAAEAGTVSSEDRARLDGYLRGRAEAEELRSLREEHRRLNEGRLARLRELELEEDAGRMRERA